MESELVVKQIMQAARKELQRTSPTDYELPFLKTRFVTSDDQLD
jgi:hypothetical protein